MTTCQRERETDRDVWGDKVVIAEVVSLIASLPCMPKQTKTYR